MHRRNLLKSLAVFPLLSFLKFDKKPRYKESIVIDYSDVYKKDEFGVIRRRLAIVEDGYQIKDFVYDKCEILSDGKLKFYIRNWLGHSSKKYYIVVRENWRIEQYDGAGQIIKILTKENWRI